METSLLKKVFGQTRDLLSLFAFFLFLVSSIPIRAQQPNMVESFTTANGLGNLGCSDVLKEPNGTLWVVHNSSTSPYNPQFPISKRDNAGNWSYPDLSILPAAIVNGTSYISNIYYQFNSIFKASNGDVWFLPKHHTLPNNDFDKTPPIVKFDGLSWSVFHSSLGSFPNKGSVLCIDEDSQGNLWFGCSNGLVRLDNTGAFSTFDPPNVVYSNGQTMQATNINSITIDVNDHIVMVSSQHKSVSGGGFFNWSCVRKYDPIASTWADWHLSDAPWWNAVQVYYYPRYVVAMHDTANTVNVSTVGGGMYYIPSAQFGSKNRTQIANFLKYSNAGWGAWGWPMENVYTNLPDFTERVFKSNSKRFWIIGSPTSSNQYKAYRYENARPAQWAGYPATQYAFSNWESNLSRVQSGTTVKAKIVSLSFVDDDTEIWFATDLGVERWYADYPNPASDFIGLEGTGPNNNGIVAWNNFSFNNPEPVRDGHILVPGSPGISIDSAYYYIATRDYDNIDPDLHAGLKGDGVVQGFGLTQAALAAAGLGFENIEIRFTPIDLGRDLKGVDEDWTYSNSLEKRRYQRRILDEKDTTSEVLSNYSILVNNQVIFHGPMPLVNLSIRYNKYGYLFDSIAGVSSYVHLTSNPLVTDPTLLSIQQALLQDVGQHGVRFQFRSIESANDESLDSPGRQGGFFEIHHAMLEKGTIILPPTPLAGKYIVGPSAHADYPDLTVALNDLHLRGLDSWVGFSLEPGTYSGQYVLGTIPGQQGFNHRFVTINSVGGDSSTVTLEYNPQYADSSFIFELKGIQQFKLQGLKFRNLSTAHPGIIKTTNASSNLEISQCTFMANQASAMPLLSGLQVNMNQFELRECKFINGTTALSIGGNNGLIEECVFQGQTDYAIKALFGSDVRIANNLILGTDTGSFSGIHLISIKDAFKVHNNRISNLNSVCHRGIFVAANSKGFAAGNDYGQVYNNEINVLGGTNSMGLSLEGVEVKYYHNTVRIHGGPQSSTALRVGWANQPLDIQRNIFLPQRMVQL